MLGKACRSILVGFLTVGFSAIAEDSKSRIAVDVQLVMAVDVSSSITGETKGGGDSEYTLQKAGIAEALRDPDLARVLEQCNLQGAALTYVEWSGSAHQEEVKQLTPWAHVRSGEDLQMLADQIDAITGRSSSGSTDIATAIDIATDLILNSNFETPRKMISLSSDGPQNVGSWRFHAYGHPNTQPESVLTAIVSESRNRAIAKGIQINALVLSSDRGLKSKARHPATPNENLRYYQQHVIGGPGAFALPVESFREYAEVFRKKLIRELNNCIS